jgi:GMP synthase (glutamine-hydrolysing)
LSTGSPFPGGLAVRILGSVTEERLALLRKLTPLSRKNHAAGLLRDLWQSFVVLLPIRSVGVMGDDRTYEM